MSRYDVVDVFISEKKVKKHPLLEENDFGGIYIGRYRSE